MQVVHHHYTVALVLISGEREREGDLEIKKKRNWTHTYHIHYLCLCVLPLLSWCALLEKNAPVSCMALFFNTGTLRHICQSGCEDRIYCPMASAQDGDCEDDGTQGRPTLPEGTFAAARKEEGAPHVAVATGGCRARKNRASEDKASYLEKLQKMVCMELV